MPCACPRPADWLEMHVMRRVDRMASTACVRWRAPWIVARVLARFRQTDEFESATSCCADGSRLSWCARICTKTDHPVCRSTELTMNALIWCARGNLHETTERCIQLLPGQDERTPQEFAGKGH